MAQIQLLPLDILPAYVPFIVQCQDGTGAKTSPSVDNLIIYEEGGADATPDAATIAGSPFDPVQINSKTGLWGVWLPKSALTAGKIYIALWEMTIDGTAAAKLEMYLACNASDFKASGFSTFDPASDTVTTDAASRTASQADVSGLATAGAAMTLTPAERVSLAGSLEAAIINDLDGTAVMQAIADLIASDMTTGDLSVAAIASAVRTAVQAVATDFQADVSGLATGAELSALQAHGDSAWSGGAGLTAEAIRADLDANSTRLAHLDAAISSRLAAMDYSTPPDVSALAISAEITALQAHGDANWATGSAPIDVSAIADAVWDEALVDHVGAGSAGEKLDAQTNPPSQDLADYRADVSGVSTHSPAQVRAELATELARLDVPVSSRLSGADYTPPPDVSPLATAARIDAMQAHGDSAWASGSATIDPATIHAALNTWTPAQTETPPPIILPPDYAEDCRIWLAVGQLAGGQGPPEEIGQASCQIVALPYYKDGRYYLGQQWAPTYDAQGGTVFWDVVRGATVQIHVRAARVRETLTVPDTAIHEIKPGT